MSVSQAEEHWLTVLGNFRPDVLAICSHFDWSTYERAFKHFWSVDINQAPRIIGRSLPHNTLPELDKDDEYRLAQAVLVYQHETHHYHQIAATATGVFLYFVKSMYCDVLREWATQLVARSRASDPNRPLLLPLVDASRSAADAFDDKYPDISFGLAISDAMSKLIGVFDDASLTIDKCIRRWDAITQFLDDKPRREGDDVRFVHFRTQLDPSQLANPGGLTLRGLLESAAHSFEIICLAGLSASETTVERIANESHWGCYRQVHDRLRDRLAFHEIVGIAPRIVTLSLQTALTSMHLAADSGLDLLIEDASPTFRAHRIIEGIRTGDISPPDLILRDGGPDAICSLFGWPLVSVMQRAYLGQKQYRGVDGMLDFMHDRHTLFCQLAVSSPVKPFLVADLGQANGVDGRSAVSFLPPFAVFGDQLVLQADASEAARMGLLLLVTFAAKELLSAKNVAATNRWFTMLCKAFRRVSEEWETVFRKEWPLTFEACFGAPWAEIAT